MDLLQTSSNAVNYLQQNKAGVLAFSGCACFIGAIGLGISVTPKVTHMIDEYKEGERTNKDLRNLIIKSSLLYLPTAAATVGGCICINNSCKEYNKQIAALTAAYVMSDTFIREYRDKVKEKIGEKKEQKIVNEVNEDRAKKSAPSTPAPDDGKKWIYIAKTGRWFRASYEDVYRMEKQLSDNFNAMKGLTWVSFNDLYNVSGIDTIPDGDYFGWDVESGIEFDYSFSRLESGEEYMIIDFDYRVDPNYIKYNRTSEYAYL